MRGVTLDGYEKGLEFYLVPKFDKLADPRVKIRYLQIWHIDDHFRSEKYQFVNMCILYRNLHNVLIYLKRIQNNQQHIYFVLMNTRIKRIYKNS